MEITEKIKKENKVLEFTEDEEPPSLGVVSAKTTHNRTLVETYLKRIKRIDISEKSLSFLQTYFPGSSVDDWNNWHWQLRNSFTKIDQLQKIIELSPEEFQAISNKNKSLPLRVTPYYTSLIQGSAPEDAIRRSVVPTINELMLGRGECPDPLSEESSSPVPNLVHRYPDRVLFLSTGFCASYCRYCTRSHMVAKDKCHIGPKAWEEAINYVKTHSEVRDVIISGGDPLTMPDSHIDYLLKSIRSIPHVEIIRIGTKAPVVLPQRITPQLIKILRKYHPLWMSIHFTHPQELTPEVNRACNLIADTGIPMGSQTVLLKGINNDPKVMTALMHGLLRIRVRPYYLYQCDPIPGSAHFRTSVEEGLDIIRAMRGFTSGYAIPHFVIDAPGGGGKIPLLPDYFIGRDGENVILKNYAGKFFNYPDLVD